MKKKEVEKFVNEVGLPLYEELTRLDKIDNEQWEGHDKPFLPLSKNEFYDTEKPMFTRTEATGDLFNNVGMKPKDVRVHSERQTIKTNEFSNIYFYIPLEDEEGNTFILSSKFRIKGRNGELWCEGFKYPIKY